MQFLCYHDASRRLKYRYFLAGSRRRRTWPPTSQMIHVKQSHSWTLSKAMLLSYTEAMVCYGIKLFRENQKGYGNTIPLPRVGSSIVILRYHPSKQLFSRRSSARRGKLDQMAANQASIFRWRLLSWLGPWP